MLSNELAELGLRLEELGLGNNIYWNTMVYISFVIVIDLNGEVVTILEAKKPVPKYHPIMIYNDRFSNSSPGTRQYPHLLCPRLISLFDKSGIEFTTFCENLHSLCSDTKNESLLRLAESLEKTDFRQCFDEFEVSVDTKKLRGYVCFSFCEDVNQTILDDESMVHATSDYLNSIVFANNNGKRCEITGLPANNIVQGHMKIYKGGQTPRLSTREAYYTYYDPEYTDDAKHLCEVGVFSELLINKAAKYIYDNVKQTFQAVQVLIDLSDCQIIPLSLTIKSFITPATDEEYTKEDWEAARGKLLKRAEKAELRFLSFGPYSQGRISAGRIGIYTKEESKNIIFALVKWLDSSVLWGMEGKPEFESPSAFSLITKGKEYGKAKEVDFINWQRDFELLLNAIFDCNLNAIRENYFKPYIEYLIKNEKQNAARRMRYCIENYGKEVDPMAKIIDTPEYVIGSYLAIMALIEMYAAKDKGVWREGYLCEAERSLLNFHTDPQGELSRLRRRSQVDITSRGIRKRGLHMLLAEKEQAIILMDFESMGLEPVYIYIGFDAQINQWYEDRRERFENGEDNDND